MAVLVTVGTTVMAYIATNLDDLVVLIVFFAQVYADNKRESDEEDHEQRDSENQSEEDKTQRMQAIHVILGQYMGFTVLMLLSMLGMVFGILVPSEYLGLFGLLPLAIGLHGLYKMVRKWAKRREKKKAEDGEIELHEYDLEGKNEEGEREVSVSDTQYHSATLEQKIEEGEKGRSTFHFSESEEEGHGTHDMTISEGRIEEKETEKKTEENEKKETKEEEEDDDDEEETALSQAVSFVLSGLLNPHALKVAVVCVANGGDSIAVYLPYFAPMNRLDFLTALIVLYVMCGLWIFLSYVLLQFKYIAVALSKWGDVIAPLLLIVLGLFILIDSEALELVMSWFFS